MVLNGAYVLQSISNKAFSLNSLYKFVTYYNPVKIKSYVTVLLTYGFIYESGIYFKHPVYKLSDKGNQVIKELNESYDSVLYSFCDQYGIIL